VLGYCSDPRQKMPAVLIEFEFELKVVFGVRAQPQLAVVTLDAHHRHTDRGIQISHLHSTWHAEPLPAHSVTVLQTAIADIALRAPHSARKPARDPCGVLAGFLDQHQRMLTLTARGLNQLLGDAKALGPQSKSPMAYGARVGVGQVGYHGASFAW